MHSAYRLCHLLGGRDNSMRERGPVGTALWKTEPREHGSATHQVLLLLHLLSFLCGLSSHRARDPQTCAWLQLSKAGVQADTAGCHMPEPQHPYICPTLQPDPAPDHPVLHLNVCHAPRATHLSGMDTWPLLGSSHVSRILVSRLWRECCCQARPGPFVVIHFLPLALFCPWHCPL